MTLQKSFVLLLSGVLSLASLPVSSWPRLNAGAPPFPQDIAGAFQGQAIMGGAAIIFKRPTRVLDLVVGAAMLVVKRPRSSINRQLELARNNARRPSARPGETTVTASNTDKAEDLKTQGNTYYDNGQYAQAVEAYQN